MSAAASIEHDPQLAARLDWDKGDGLVPAIIQHALNGSVLMLGYMNREALAATPPVTASPFRLCAPTATPIRC
jgi:phosphoribosyl-ATP pyrophosphohydrolase/phosphoribosyl-AMP cyclohydrolase